MRTLLGIASIGFIIGGVASAEAADESFSLNLYTLQAEECGAGLSIPEECLSRGEQMCSEAQEELLEVAIQFKPGTREVATMWFRCAAGN